MITIYIYRAALVLNPKIKKYKLKEVQNIISSEYPIDTILTDTKMSGLCLACSYVPKDGEDDKN